MMSEPLKPLSWYKDLADAAARRETGFFLVEGERAVRQIHELLPDSISELLYTDTIPAGLEPYPSRLVTTSRFDAISNVATPQGIMALVKLPEKTYTSTIPENAGNRLLMLEDIQDPGNVGTLVRTAAAFDYDGVIMSGKCADPFSPKCVQSAAGTILSLWIRRTDDYLEMLRTLKMQNYKVVAATLDGDEQPDTLRAGKLVLALGNESAGLSPELQELADARFRLAVVRQKAESLNVAVAGGICMYLSNQVE